MALHTISLDGLEFPIHEVGTLVIGSGAASLNCAESLYDMGCTDLAIVTEKIGGGTSNNTGSDKQTYYKLSVSGKEPDSPWEMAQSLYNGGAMHGDLALIEATLSAQGFFHLAQIGVKFPYNSYGAFVGYKTDHDPRQRATSAGPLTSHQMVQCLLKQIKSKNIAIYDNHDIIALLVDDNRAVGAIAIDKNNIEAPHYGMVFFKADDVVFGVGGPGGLYRTSVYPEVHIGAIGLALEIGAVARNLTESQYGLASTQFRWNVSGTYQQVIPRYISTDANGNDEQEFLNPWFPDMGSLATAVFLKGYQWPFDPRKIPNRGSSLVDVLVYIETVVKGRSVFMDFRENPRGDKRIGAFKFDDLGQEAYQYLKNSEALFGTPIERLQKMNPLAIELYDQHDIDIRTEPLEVAVCAQHNNGGLAGNLWWESNIRHLYPVGEVNGSHGVYRPGGTALNSGQVGSLRAAQIINARKGKYPASMDAFLNAAQNQGSHLLEMVRYFTGNLTARNTAVRYRLEFQERMTRYGSHIRDRAQTETAIRDAYEQIRRFEEQTISSLNDLPYLMQNRHLVLAHAAYLEAIKAYLDNNGGSRGSYMVMDTKGEPVLDELGDPWRYKLENEELRDWVIETVMDENGTFTSSWKKRRPVPEQESWFENVWAKYMNGSIYINGDY